MSVEPSKGGGRAASEPFICLSSDDEDAVAIVAQKQYQPAEPPSDEQLTGQTAYTELSKYLSKIHFTENTSISKHD